MDGNRKFGTEQTVDTADVGNAARIARRRTLLKGLGMGSTLLSAAAPISSFAGSKVPKDDGFHCTVSGQQSKLMSQNASTTPCGGYHCTYFVKCEVVDYSSCPKEVKSACNSVGKWYEYTSGGSVYYRSSTSKCKKLSKDSAWPSSTVSWNLKCNAVFPGGSSSKTCLQRIYEDPESDDSYCIAGYLNSELSATPPSGYQKLPFRKDYVKYSVERDKASSAKLFRKTCVKNKRTLA